MVLTFATAVSAAAIATPVYAELVMSLPSPTTTNCAKLPSSCGYPDARNTGPLKSIVPVRVPEDRTSGPGWAWEPSFNRLRITGAGAVVDGIEVHAPVVIDAPDVTLSNSIVMACNEIFVVGVRAGNPGDGYDGRNAKIIHNRLGCDGASTARADRGVSDVYAAATGLNVIRNDIFNVSNGVTAEATAVIRGNWIHDLGNKPGDHHSGLSTHGQASRIVFDLNTVLLSQTGVSGAITVYSDFGAAKNVSITRNLVSGGSYCVYGGDSGDFGPAAGNITMQYNRFSRIYGANKHCGLYGEDAAYSPAAGEWSGNVWDETLANVKR